MYHWSVPVLLLIASGYLYHKPAYNWDMFPYMALTATTPEVPMDTTHELIYREAARLLPPHDFKAISNIQPARMQSAAAFQEILKYYEIKPGYVMMTRILYAWGFNLVAATYFPSILSYFLMGCILWWWMMKLFDHPVAIVITLLVAASPFLVQTARYSSPDMLCALLLLGGICLIAKVSIPVGMILCGLAIPVRPDSAILFLLVVLAVYKSEKLKLTHALVCALAGLGTTLWVVGGFDILKEYLFTVPGYSEAWTANELIKNYLLGLRTGINSMINSHAWIFAVVAVLALYIRGRQGIAISKDLWSLLMMSAMVAVVARYLMHPVLEDRFLIASYLVVFIGLCKTIASTSSPKTSVI